jgi:hypothetical protein
VHRRRRPRRSPPPVAASVGDFGCPFYDRDIEVESGPPLGAHRFCDRLERTLGCFLELVEATKHFPQIRKVWVEFLGEHPNAATDRVEESEVVAA